MLAQRLLQITKFGHTPEADRNLPLAKLAEPTWDYVRRTREDISCHAHRDVTLTHATKAAAQLLALIDRLISEQKGA